MLIFCIYLRDASLQPVWPSTNDVRVDSLRFSEGLGFSKHDVVFDGDIANRMDGTVGLTASAGHPDSIVDFVVHISGDAAGVAFSSDDGILAEEVRGTHGRRDCEGAVRGCHALPHGTVLLHNLGGRLCSSEFGNPLVNTYHERGQGGCVACEGLDLVGLDEEGRSSAVQERWSIVSLVHEVDGDLTAQYGVCAVDIHELIKAPGLVIGAPNIWVSERVGQEGNLRDIIGGGIVQGRADTEAELRPHTRRESKLSTGDRDDLVLGMATAPCDPLGPGICDTGGAGPRRTVDTGRGADPRVKAMGRAGTTINGHLLAVEGGGGNTCPFYRIDFR